MQKQEEIKAILQLVCRAYFHEEKEAGVYVYLHPISHHA